jgi:hypothetical protein
MTEKFETVTANHRCKENIYVKADGKTVCAGTDKEVAFLKHGINSVITPAQHAALIFPDTGVATEVPDAGERGAETLPDAEKRGGKSKK